MPIASSAHPAGRVNLIFSPAAKLLLRLLMVMTRLPIAPAVWKAGTSVSMFVPSDEAVIAERAAEDVKSRCTFALVSVCSCTKAATCTLVAVLTLLHVNTVLTESFAIAEMHMTTTPKRSRHE